MHADDSNAPRDAGRFVLLSTLGWVEVREVGVPGAWLATDSPVDVEE